MNKYQLNTNKTLRVEYANWESLFSNLEHAQGSSLINTDKMSWLTERLSNDPRPAILSCFINCMINNYDYTTTMEKILLISEGLAHELATHRAAAVTTPAYFPPSYIPPEVGSSREFEAYENSVRNQQLNSYQSNIGSPQAPYYKYPKYNIDINSKMSDEARNKLDDVNKKPALNNGYCFAFQKNGVCNNRNCKYIHGPNPEANTNRPPNKPPREIRLPSTHQIQPMNPSRPQ